MAAIGGTDSLKCLNCREATTNAFGLIDMKHIDDKWLSELRKLHMDGKINTAMEAFHLVVGLVERPQFVDTGLQIANELKDRFPLVGEGVATYAYASPPFYMTPRTKCEREWVEWMRIGARSEGEAAMLLGNYFMEVEDFASALSAYEMGVAIGSAENAFAIGYMYESGHHVDRDLAKACEWFMRAGRMDWNGWLTTDENAVPVDSNGVWRDQELLASYLAESNEDEQAAILASVNPKVPWPEIFRSSGTTLFSRIGTYGQSPEHVWTDDGVSLLERGEAMMTAGVKRDLKIRVRLLEAAAERGILTVEALYERLRPYDLKLSFDQFRAQVSDTNEIHYGLISAVCTELQIDPDDVIQMHPHS